jgi:hypothetical protein
MKTTKQSNRCDGVAPSPIPDKRKTPKAKQELSDDEFVDSLLDFFRDLPAFTFVVDFPVRDSAQGPSMSSVVDLLICARQGSAYRGPYMDGEAELLGIDFATAGKRRREIVTAVESRLAELRRRGIEFAICWCAYGDEPRLDWSGDGDEDKLDVYQRLAEHPKELFDMPVE